ncbi:hypothetical protein ABK040_000219 [Willaertia magna]
MNERKIVPLMKGDSVKGSSSATFTSAAQLISQKTGIIANNMKQNGKRLISLRLMVTIVIVALVLLCSVFIWLSSFLTTSEGFQTFYEITEKTIGEKVETSLDLFIKPIINIAKNTASDWNTGIVDSNDIGKEYLITKYKDFELNGVGYYFGENGTSAILVIYQGLSDGKLVNYFAYKPLEREGIFNNYVADLNNNTFELFDTDNHYNVSEEDYYVKRDGFILVTEENNMVGGSINTTTADKRGRLSLFELSDRNAGQLMKDIYERYKSDILGGVIRSTQVSAGVAAGMLFIGLISSIIVGIVITSPLKFLEKQFELIKCFNLDEVDSKKSIFSELNNIYTNLDQMVTWLQEFKSFLPENVFLQLAGFAEEISPKVDNHEKSSQKSLFTSKGSSMKSSVEVSEINPLFKLGLLHKECSIVFIRLPNFCKLRYSEEISLLFSRLITQIVSITKNFKGDIQIHSVEEIQITFTGSTESIMKALRSALRISKAITDCQNNSEINIDFNIGVSSGKAYIGNLGNNHFRYYTIVGEVRNTARKLTYLAEALKLKILFDENAFIENLFVTRPVDKIKVEEKGKFKHLVVFELIKENKIESDEWMYELEQQKENIKFKEFEKAISFLKMSSKMNNNTELLELSYEEINERLKHALDVVIRHSHLMPEDAVICNRLVTILKLLLQNNSKPEIMESLHEYHTDICVKVSNEFSDSCNELLL